MSWIKRFLLWLALPFVIGLVIAETYGQLLRNPSPNNNDDILGWRSKSNFQYTYSQQDLSGEKYDAEWKTNELGLRTYDTSDESSTGILVLGDSFTMGQHASDSKMWFSVMADDIYKKTGKSIFIWAGGGGGYGTYQNLLLADQVKDLINPDFFILQFCLNDFINNHIEWETKTILRAQFMRRPYYSAEERPVFYSHPLAFLYRSKLIGQSKVFNKIDSLISGIQYQYYGGYGKKLPDEMMRPYEEESISITRILLVKLRHVFTTLPAIMVNCSGSLEGANKYWIDLAKVAGYIPISGPSSAIQDSERNGETVHHRDGQHLNEYGNYVFGKALAKSMIEENIIGLGP